MSKKNKQKPAVVTPIKNKESNSLVLFFDKNLKVILFGIFLIALIVRIAPMGKVFRNGEVFFFENDTYYHMMRVINTVHHFPNAFVKDTYLDYPRGYNCFWPPLFDQSIAFISIIAGFGSPSEYTIKAVGAFFPAILGALTIFIVYLFGKEIFNRKVGILSAGMLAIMPAHYIYSLIGRPDHHVTEPVFSTLMFLFFVIACRKSEKKDILIYSILAGFSGFLALLTWIGSSTFIGLLGIFIVFQSVLIVRRNEQTGNRPSPLSSGALPVARHELLFVAQQPTRGEDDNVSLLNFINIGLFIFVPLLVFVIPFCLLSFWGKQGLIEYDALSLFQPLFIAGFVLLFILAKIIANFVSNNKLKWYWYPAFLCLSCIVVIVLAILISPKFYQSLMSGMSYFSKGDSWFAGIGEMQPLLKPRFGFPISFAQSDLFFAKLFYVFFIALTMFIIEFTKKKERSMKKFLFLFITLITTLMVLNQLRFIHVFVISFVIIISYFIIKVIDSVNIYSFKNIIISAILLLFFVIPALKYDLSPVYSSEQFGPPSELYDTLKWLEENTPQTSYFADLDQKPEYGVLAPWAYGMWIECIAQRPVLASNFHKMYGNEECAKYYLCEDENEANDILDRNNIRYILTSSMLSSERLGDCIIHLGKDKSLYYTKSVNPATSQVAYGPTVKYYNLVNERLFLIDGAQIDITGSTSTFVIKGLGHYRLIYESMSDDYTVPIPRPVKQYKIFEYVKGATLRGRIAPNEKVTVTLNIKTNQNREFQYLSTGIADKNGNLALSLPYPTKGSAYQVKAEGSYLIDRNGRKSKIDVTEEQILLGKEIYIK